MRLHLNCKIVLESFFFDVIRRIVRISFATCGRVSSTLLHNIRMKDRTKLFIQGNNPTLYNILRDIYTMFDVSLINSRFCEFHTSCLLASIFFKTYSDVTQSKFIVIFFLKIYNI